MGGGPPWCCKYWSVIFFSSDLHQPVLVGLLLHGCAGTPAYSFPLFRVFFVGAATTHAGPRRRPKATCLKNIYFAFLHYFYCRLPDVHLLCHFVSLRRRPGLRSSTATRALPVRHSRLRSLPGALRGSKTRRGSGVATQQVCVQNFIFSD